MLSVFVLALAVSSVAQAHKSSLHKRAVSSKPRCSLSNATLSLPTAGDVEVVPGDVLEYLGLAVGNQLYSCSNSAWQAVGTSATIYDASCVYNATSMTFNTLSSTALLLNTTAHSLVGSALSDLVGTELPTIGAIKTVTIDGELEIDFRRSAGGSFPNSGQTGYMTLQQIASQPAPVAAYDMPWTQSKSTEGSLADQAFLVSTSGGMPNTIACSNGATQEAPFSAQLWMFSSGDLVAVSSTPCKDARKGSNKAVRKLVVFTTSVMYGVSDQTCTSVEDCTTKCLADKACVGFDLSTEDNIGRTKTYVGQNSITFCTTNHLQSTTTPYHTHNLITMDQAKQAVKDFMSKSGHHDTTVHEKVAPAVTHETIQRTQHENVQTAIDKEVHQDHYHTSVQPVEDREVLPEKHHHNIVPVEHRTFEHDNAKDVEARLAAEQARFRDEQQVVTGEHTSSMNPVVAGEHIHHHVHETIQPVVNKQTIEPHVVHTTVPIHEVHHNAAQHHSTSALPAVSMADFKKQGGVLTGREERYDGFEGEPRSVGGALGGSSEASAMGASGLQGRSTDAYGSNTSSTGQGMGAGTATGAVTSETTTGTAGKSHHFGTTDGPARGSRGADEFVATHPNA